MIQTVPFSKSSKFVGFLKKEVPVFHKSVFLTWWSSVARLAEITKISDEIVTYTL